MKADPGHPEIPPPFPQCKYLPSIPKRPNIWHRSRHATILSSPSKKEAAIYLWAWQTSALFGRARACGYHPAMMIIAEIIAIISIRVIWSQWWGD